MAELKNVCQDFLCPRSTADGASWLLVLLSLHLGAEIALAPRAAAVGLLLPAVCPDVT